jgi:NADPH-dependent glutamate synthase beta subunit-like oxidoreductase/Pyruvate/2-oxoacid:ferredoxin oxidoreductase delta subunit
MNRGGISIKEIEPIAPFSQGTTEIFFTGHWSSKKPVYTEKTSPCRQACPIGSDIASAFYYASKGDYDQALAIYRRDNPLPGVCGRVCYRPCELSCNRGEFDESVNIRGFERFLSDNGKVDIRAEVPTRLRRERISVIGSGPAGLSASYHLARLGYLVTIFEALPEPGGMLAYGIPEYRLPKEILRKEIGYIRQLGVEIKTGIQVGKEITLAEIRSECQAVFIAAGAHGGVRLGVEGDGLPGVLEGIGFLRDVNLGKKVKIGKRVAVIGGGNTAIDCARVARRVGGKEITIVYRRSRAEMPAMPEDLESLEKEGIKVELLAVPTRVVSQHGRVSGIECLRTALGAPDAGGRPKPSPLRGTEFMLPVDTVIAAVGQVPEVQFAKDLGINVGNKGVIEISRETAATNIEGVFAGGDGTGANAFVADAIASGKVGALAVFCYLEGKEIKQELTGHRIGDHQIVNGAPFSFQHVIDPEKYPVDLKQVVPYGKINTLCFIHGVRNHNPERPLSKGGIKNFDERTGGIDPARMPAEIDRCFKCGACTHCDLCFLLCPDISIVKTVKEKYTIREEYCKGCAVCASSCPGNVIEITGGGR